MSGKKYHWLNPKNGRYAICGYVGLWALKYADVTCEHCQSLLVSDDSPHASPQARAALAPNVIPFKSKRKPISISIGGREIKPFMDEP